VNPIMDAVAGIVKPIAELIGGMHTSVEEKGKLQVALSTLQVGLASNALEHEFKNLEAQKAIIVAEAAGESWLQRSWRPITMLSFLALIAADFFGFLVRPLPPEAWALLQLGLGGYVIGRSAEKVIPSAIAALGDLRVGGKK
jgi:hypothetical protein